MKSWVPILAGFLLSASFSHADVIAAGRTHDPEHSFSLYGSVGEITDIQGDVQETTRRLFVVTGEPERQKGQVSYNFNELGLKRSDLMYGLRMDKAWRFLTLRFEAASLTAAARGTAPRDVFIAVDKISFQGKDYKYQKLEDGKPYKATLDGLFADLGFDLTPFTLNPSGVVQVTPWAHVGVVGVGAQFEVDQGPAVRLQTYENPPHTYVVQGHGEGDEGAVSPEFGLGGEVKLRLGERLHRPVSLAMQGTYSIFQLSGDTGDFGIGSRTDKNVDLNYDAYDARAQFELPLTRALDLLIGASYRVIEIDATVKAKDRSLEETLRRREKFDKDITLDLTMVTGYIGLRW